MGVISNDQKVESADSEASDFAGYDLCLYKSAHTPVDTDTASTYTSIEADFSGYARVPIGAFMAAYLNGSSEGEADHAPIVFTCTGAAPSNDMHGCFILRGSGALAFAEEYGGAAFTMDAAGKTWTVNLALLLDNLP